MSAVKPPSSYRGCQILIDIRGPIWKLGEKLYNFLSICSLFRVVFCYRMQASSAGSELLEGMRLLHLKSSYVVWITFSSPESHFIHGRSFLCRHDKFNLYLRYARPK